MEYLASNSRRLPSLVRCDWDWPLPAHLIFPPPSLAVSVSVSSSFTSSSSSSSPPPPSIPTGYRPRSADNSPPISRPVSPSPSAAMLPPESHRAKRRRLDLDEAGWNDGARLFAARRDAWTGAVLLPETPAESDSTSTTAKANLNAVLLLQRSSQNSSCPGLIGAVTPSFACHAPSISTATTTSTTILLPHIPIMPPLLPAAHPSRATLGPPLYASVYSHVVIRGTVPRLPINLREMTHALVHGWKADGEWPPVSSAAAATIAGLAGGGEGALVQAAGKRRRRGKGENGVERLRRALGWVEREGG